MIGPGLGSTHSSCTWSRWTLPERTYRTVCWLLSLGICDHRSPTGIQGRIDILLHCPESYAGSFISAQHLSDGQSQGSALITLSTPTSPLKNVVQSHGFTPLPTTSFNDSQSYLPVYKHLLIDISTCISISNFDFTYKSWPVLPKLVFSKSPHLCKVETRSSQLQRPCN